MIIKDWKRDVFTIPNLLSLFRLLLLPVYAYLYLTAVTQQDFLLAGTVMALSCLTDLVDGKIARKFNMISTLGKILDPFADKITQFTLTLCLSMRHPVLWPVLGLFIVKELFQLTVGAVHLRKGKMLPGALMAGKVCTTVLFVSLIALVLFPSMDPSVVSIIAAIDAGFLIISFVSYIFAYFGRHRKIQDLEG